MDNESVHKIKSPLPDDANGVSPLLLRQLRAKEELSRLFTYEVDMFSAKDDIDPIDLLGKPMTVSVRLAQNAQTRHFNGIVASFSYQGRADGNSRYHAVLRPWIWLLTQNFDCRIFQNMTAPNIFEKVCKETHGFSDYTLTSLSESYRKREYCVQYRESDFSFVSRLLEEEGIFYYFEHDEQKHTLVLADDNSDFPDVTGEKDVVFRPPGESRVDLEHISVWSVGHEVQTGACVLDDYDFTKPRVDLAGRSAIQRKHSHAAYEMYDYPGLHWEATDGETLARIRIEEVQSRHKRYSGVADHRNFTPGRAFKLKDYPREKEDTEYIILATDIKVDSAEVEQFRAEAENLFEVSFKAIDRSDPFRPERLTPKPFVRGPQTAVVVGKNGEEIWTDKYARVKVQFHWDREGHSDENSSCWVRVSQVWAGKNWGGIQIPRIGQEVIVDFLEGDPDRPLITGRVYNDGQMPPYALPDNQTQSGIISRSSKNGTPENFNELRFEDKADEEKIYIHAEKDFERIVEDNDVLKVGFEKKSPGSQTIEIFKDRTATIKTGDDGTTVEKGNHAINVKAGESLIEAAQKITLKVGGSTITIEPAKITLSSPEIAISGTAKVGLTAPTSQVNGSATLMLNGGVVKIN
jgi:type VI secretion system secreted protein VgrG